MREVAPDTHWVLSIDPGKATGWAMLDLGATGAEPLFGEVDGRYAAAQFVRDVLGQGVFVEIVCEQFVISERTIKTAQDPNALRIIGWLDIQCEHLGVPLTFQTAVSAKKFATDDTLKAVGWWNPTPDGHQNDALRHLLRYISAHHQNVARPVLERMRS